MSNYIVREHRDSTAMMYKRELGYPYIGKYAKVLQRGEEVYCFQVIDGEVVKGVGSWNIVRERCGPNNDCDYEVFFFKYGNNSNSLEWHLTKKQAIEAWNKDIDNRCAAIDEKIDTLQQEYMELNRKLIKL